MSEEIAKVDAPVAPEVAPVAETAQENTPTAEAPATVAEPAQTTEVKDAPVPQETVPEGEAQEDTPEDTPEATSEEAPSAAAEPKKPRPKFKPNKKPLPQKKPMPQKAAPVQKKRPPTDEEIRQTWKENLLRRGAFKDEKVIDTITEYAVKHRGFDANRAWGGCLVSMLALLIVKFRGMPEFHQVDAETLFRKLQGFLATDIASTIGEGPMDWNQMDNMDQRRSIDTYFGIDKPLHLIPEEDQTILAFRQVAWPSQMESERRIGGSFADRFVYLAYAYTALMMVPEISDKLFECAIHEKPLPAFIEVDEQGHQTCKECGSMVVLDRHGNPVCSSAICPNHIAACVSVPRAQPNEQRRERFNDDRENRGFEKRGHKPKFKKGARRFRNNDDSGSDEPYDNQEPRPPREWSFGPGEGEAGAGFGGGAFDKL